MRKKHYCGCITEANFDHVWIVKQCRYINNDWHYLQKMLQHRPLDNLMKK